MHDSQVPIYRTKRRMYIPKSMSIVKSWDIIGPLVAEKIAGSDYSPIPYCIDADAYKIGHIFVQTTTQVGCFRAIPVLEVLGPICNFIDRTKTDSKWHDKDIHTMKSTGEDVNFRIIAEHGKNSISFTGHHYYFLSKAHDMPIEGNVTINRSSHEELSQVKWFGLITDVVVATIFEFRVVKDLWERTVYIGDKPHTILFKYEICHIDENGAVRKTTNEKIPGKWLKLHQRNPDKLSATEF